MDYYLNFAGSPNMSKKMATRINREPARTFNEESYDQFLKRVARHNRRRDIWAVVQGIAIAVVLAAVAYGLLLEYYWEF